VTFVKMLTKRKALAERCVGQDRHFLPVHIQSDCKRKNEYVI